MTACRSDALVFFGATGDLAAKKIFPALHAMARRGHLDFPVIGVALADGMHGDLAQRARESIEQHGGGVDPNALATLKARLRFVNGKYEDAATYAAIRKELGESKRPAHYLAIPPSLFATVVDGLGGSGCSEGARVILE